MTSFVHYLEFSFASARVRHPDIMLAEVKVDQTFALLRIPMRAA